MTKAVEFETLERRTTSVLVSTVTDVEEIGMRRMPGYRLDTDGPKPWCELKKENGTTLKVMGTLAEVKTKLGWSK